MQYPGYNSIFQCHVKLNYVNLMYKKKVFLGNLVGPPQLRFSLNHKSCPFQLGIHFHASVKKKQRKMKELQARHLCHTKKEATWSWCWAHLPIFYEISRLISWMNVIVVWILVKAEWIVVHSKFRSSPDKRADKQRDGQKVMHMSPPCKLHRWATKIKIFFAYLRCMILAW